MRAEIKSLKEQLKKATVNEASRNESVRDLYSSLADLVFQRD